MKNIPNVKLTIPDLLKFRDPIDDQCKGCRRTEIVDKEELCCVYLEPALRWRLGECGLSTHHGREVIVEADKYKSKKTGKKRRGI